MFSIVVVTLGCSGTAKEPAVAKHGDGGPQAADAALSTPRDAVVFASASPDDGPGYTLAFGRGSASPQRCDYFGSYGTASRFRLFPDGPYVLLRIEADQTRTLPAQIPLARGDEAEAMQCSADDRCEPAKAGQIELVELVPGGRARGRYELELASGTVAASFDATWCGPVR
jgi:hypothetical protein